MFTWNESVAIALITILRDSELVIYFMGILKPMRRDFVEDEAREWHKSLRISQKERWKRIEDLRKRRKFSEMNSSVPITFALPFDGGMWRNSRELMKMIRYFRESFIRKRRSWQYEDTTEEEIVSNKIKIVNLMNEKSCRGNIFRSECSLSMIDESLMDLILFSDDDNNEWEELPYIEVIGNLCNVPDKYWDSKWRLGYELPIIAIVN